MAEAYSFLAHMNICCGYGPSEPVGEKESLYRAVEGARFTNYTDFTSYLNAVFTRNWQKATQTVPADDEKMNFYAGGYMQGENDDLWFTDGERGTNVLYCGTTFTEPELQSDGSLTFWQLACRPIMIVLKAGHSRLRLRTGEGNACPSGFHRKRLAGDRRELPL